MEDQNILQPSNEETVLNQFYLAKEENEKLARENTALKNSLQKEELYHKNLYRQWSQLNADINKKTQELQRLKQTQRPKEKLYTYAFYGLLLITILLVIFNFFAFTKKDNKNSGAVESAAIHKPGDTPVTVSYATKQKDITENISKQTAANTAPINKLNLQKNQSDNLTARKYMVKVKTYFHNEPDSTTKRSTFLLPWNDSYGIVTALDDKNGFIHVIFKNKAGRTSRGWILKSDLEPLDQ